MKIFIINAYGILVWHMAGGYIEYRVKLYLLYGGDERQKEKKERREVS